MVGLAFMVSCCVRADDTWAFGRGLITHPTLEGPEAYVYTHVDPNQLEYGLPGISYKPVRSASLKAVSVLMRGDPSDVFTHYFGVYLNTMENFQTNALGGQSFLFDPGQPSTFAVEPWEPDGVATDFLVITLTFSEPLALSPDHSWMISPVIELDAFQDSDYVPSMIACQSSSHWDQPSSLGPKIDQYSTQSSTFPLQTQLAADLLVSVAPAPQAPLPVLAFNTGLLGLQLTKRSIELRLFTVLNAAIW